MSTLEAFPKRSAIDVIRRRLPQFTVEDHPYDLGYWARIAGFDRPSSDQLMQSGWDRADFELKEEE